MQLVLYLHLTQLYQAGPQCRLNRIKSVKTAILDLVKLKPIKTWHMYVLETARDFKSYHRQSYHNYEQS